jgi:hypothetical protein
MVNGYLPLMLAGISIVLRRKGPLLFFAGIALAALLEALSGRLLGWLPWYGGFRIPERVVWVVVLSMALLAGFGWHELRSWGFPDRKRRLAIAVGIASVAWGLILCFGFKAREGTVLFLASAAGATAALILAPRWRFVAAAMVVVDLGTAGFLEIRTVPPETASPVCWYEAGIGPQRESFRLLDLSSYKAAAVSRGFHLLRGYGHPVLPGLVTLYASAWKDPLASLDTLPSGSVLQDVSVLRDLNVRWIVAGGAPAHPDWRPITHHGGLTLYEDPFARPSAHLGDSPGTLLFQRVSAHRFKAEVNVERPGTLFLGESWAPGWTAELNGAPIEIGCHRASLMKIDCPAGASQIRMTYAPVSWKWGWRITGSAFVLWIILAVGIGLRHFRFPV